MADSASGTHDSSAAQVIEVHDDNLSGLAIRVPAQNRTAQQGEEISRRNAQRAAKVTTSALQHNTVFPGTTYVGFVYFPHRLTRSAPKGNF